jgi:RimJ/RimL family protein N-acetyltransferase
MIITDRLIIRSFEDADGEKLMAMLQDPIFMEYSDSGAFDAHSAAIRFGTMLDNSQSGLGKKALILKGTNEFIGYCGIEPFELDGTGELELGYRLLASYRGKGYATEAAQAVISTFVGAKLFAYVEPENINSIRVLLKLRFEKLGLRQIKDKSCLLFLYSRDSSQAS